MRGPDSASAPLTASELRESVAELFRAPPDRGHRVGIEVEVIPVALADGRRVPPRAPDGGLALAPVLEVLAGAEGWTPGRNPAGAPSWRLVNGGMISWEPGGQLEYSSPPLDNLAALEADAAGVMSRIAAAARTVGIGLLARGIDPINPLSSARLELTHDRYARMSRHYARRGPEGVRKMRQTAALHVNLELGSSPLERFAAAGRIVPALIAAFANAPRMHGARRPARSHRAELWRVLDPTRTGVFGGPETGIDDYLTFALDAEAFLLGDERAPARTFRSWAGRATLEEWRTHLSTLFPEVRPRGYLELRFFDAVPAVGYGLGAAVAAGLLHDDENVARILASVPVPDRDRLIRAGRGGVTDPELGSEAVRLLGWAGEGLERLPDAHSTSGLRARVEAFRTGFTRRGRDPGSADAALVDETGGWGSITRSAPARSRRVRSRPSDAGEPGAIRPRR